MTYNGDCENCEQYREAVAKCPCGCGRMICRRCLRAVHRAMRSHLLKKVTAPIPYEIGDPRREGWLRGITDSWKEPR